MQLMRRKRWRSFMVDGNTGKLLGTNVDVAEEREAVTLAEIGSGKEEVCWPLTHLYYIL